MHAGDVTLSRVVVLGAKGFVASRLIRLLGRHGLPCRPVGSAEVDLSEPSAAEKLRRIIQPDDAMVVAAGLTPERGRDRATFRKNVAMIDSVCGAVETAPCAHVIYISSGSVYDSRCEDIDESSRCETDDPYGLAHIVREKLLAQACRGAKVGLAIIRPSAIYGAGDTHNSYGPNRFLRSALREGRIALFGEGEEERDHIYIDDVVYLIRLTLLGRRCGVMNAAHGEPLTFRDAALGIRKAVGAEVALVVEPRRVPIRHQRFDTAALRQAFPEFRPTPFETGVLKALGELRESAP
jgi:nucleoside-diphosphate-sugar epimerase